MFNNAFRYFAGSYFQLIPLTIIIQACIGSIAVYYILQGIPNLGHVPIALLCYSYYYVSRRNIGSNSCEKSVLYFHIWLDGQPNTFNNPVGRIIFF